MAASMRRIFGKSLVPQIQQKLLSPASTPWRTGCINQKSIQHGVVSPLTTPIRGVTLASLRGIASAPLHQSTAIQEDHWRSSELSQVCSRLTGLNLQAPAPNVARGQIQGRSFSSLICSRYTGGFSYNEIINQKFVKPQVFNHQPNRTVIRFSKNKGKKKTVHAVIDRFYRLDNGLWVRTQAGRAKKLWKKSPRRRHRLKQHIFCNKTQSKMLDRMVSGYWKKRRHYLDDPFEQYHDRHFDVIPPGSNVKEQ
ncbi:large ribosomal subunit protein bL35m-like isoform X1 [Lytechinus pictus]|uniref:large ribosomal subunit protein bL35m-like isoform X1 n=1 Tax=Lytechinus pictus TaxID=7653 RepID=UPI0030B9E0C6